MRSVPTFLHARSSAFWDSRTANTLASSGSSARSRASAETARAHRESAAHGAVPNSSCPSRGRRAQRFRQLQNPHPAIRARSLRPYASPYGQAEREVGAITRIATVARAHFHNQRVEFLHRRQRDLFPANGSTFQSRCGIAVNHTSFDCDVQNVSKKGDCVVVVSGRRNFRVALAHFLQSAGVILRISVSFRPGQLLISAAKRCRQ